MDPRTFYSVPYGARNTHNMKIVRMRCGGIVAFGRWQALLGILYESDGVVDLSDEITRKVVEAELELKGKQLDEFIEAVIAVGWVDLTLWRTMQHVVCKGVTDQLAYKQEQSSNGKKGGRPKKAGQEGASAEKG